MATVKEEVLLLAASLHRHKKTDAEQVISLLHAFVLSLIQISQLPASINMKNDITILRHIYSSGKAMIDLVGTHAGKLSFAHLVPIGHVLWQATFMVRIPFPPCSLLI